MGNKSIISRVRKRDGRIVLFDQERITNAVFKAAQAVGGTDKELSKKLSHQVVRILEERFGTDITPTVEQIQDLIEKTLIENGHVKTSKAFILYREQRRKLREMAVLTEPIGIVEGYIRQNDWKVNENSNMTYSLQGLNNHISNAIISKYWLEKLYTPRIREAYEKGDIHVHDLGTLGCYCVGWDLKDLLLSGFKGVSGKVESKPPKHFRTALGQAVNFFYTLQGEAAGAMAFSNFDTLLAPFIAYDKLTSAEIKQALQEFLFNMNVPTRVGFQCLSEDTEILTIDGWKRYDEIEKGTMIKTLNIKKMIIEDKKVKSVFKKHYKGVMYNLKNRIQDQLISPGHRIVRKKFNTSRYVLEPIEEVLKLKSPIITLVSTDNLKDDASISDEQIKLIAWIIGEGSVEKRSRHGSCYRVSIYQSAIKNKSNYEEIKSLLNHFKLNYSEYTQHGLGSPVQRIRLNADSSKVIHNWLSKENVKFIPNQFLNMSQKQSKLFIDTFMKAEGFEGCKIATSDVDILNDLQAVVTNAGYGSTVLKREPTIGTKSIYVLRLIKHKETYIKRITKVDYKGIIWCPNTENETVIARRNGKVFITGNTPFSNITLDLKVPDFMREEHVLIGGKLMDKKYKHFQREIDLFNEILAEVILEGDASGRVFTFPIPTYNITKDFNWDNSAYDNIWEMTAKYGVPYFSNFVNSDMKPDDARSMCCRLRLDKRELQKRGGGLFGSNPLTGSIGVVTINLARIGYLTKTEEEFFERLSNLMDLSKESLEIKRKALEDFTEQNLYPYSKFYLRHMKTSTGLYWKNHFSTIGILGMNEALLNFIQKDIASEEGRKLAIKVLDFMRKKISEYQQETGNIYNLEATPGEGTTYRFAKKDKEMYPNIIAANEKAYQERKAAPFYTNSSQLPVGHTDDIFEALMLQDELQSRYTGGTVMHCFLGEKISSVETTKALVRKIAENFKIPYFTLTPTFSICPKHGYLVGEHEYCPKCDEEISYKEVK